MNTLKMDNMRSYGIAALLLLASAAVACAQTCNQGFTITTKSLPNGTLGVAYSQTLQTNGALAPVSWSILSGALPPGLGLDPAAGTISGTPTTTGIFSFQVEAEFNTSAEQCATQSYSVGIMTPSGPCVPTLTPGTPLPQADIDVNYLQRFMIAGCSGAYTFTLVANQFVANSLPPGLTLSTGGTFKGLPGNVGTYNFQIVLTDSSQQQTSYPYSLTINALPTIATSSPLPNAPVGVAYSQQFTATGGVPPYTFSMNGQPPGIVNITADGGVVFGTPTTAGTYNFNVAVTDSVGGESSTPFQVTFVTAASELQVGPQSITFNADLNGNPPQTQAIAVVPVSGAAAANFRVQIDAGQAGSAAPAWINVTPVSSVAPAGLVVSVDQGTMPAGAYPARIQILDSNGFPTNISVTLNVAAAVQQLNAGPYILNFGARAATPGSLNEDLVITSSGAGSLGFTTSVLGGSPWISSVTSSSSTTARNAPVFVHVQVNTSGLKVGAYHDVILLSSSTSSIQVPVSLFVAAGGPVLGLNTTGVLFQAVAGGGSTDSKVVEVLNTGDPSSTVHWKATLLSGSNWLHLVSSSGTATGSTPGTLTLALAPNATQLSQGPYYANIEITDSNSLNSPEYITAVLNLEPGTAAAAPDLEPGGLFFTAQAGGAAPAAQQVQVNTSSAATVNFAAAATTADGNPWLTVTPASGSANGQTSGSIGVSVNPTGLAAGIYSGDANVSIGGLLQSVNVTFVVQPGSSNAAVQSIGRFRPEAAGCSATKLAITETGLANNFAVPAGWPATLIVQLDNDCASSVTNGNVIASFSNGDSPLNLVGDSLGNYSTTWQPGGVNANMVVTLNATAGTLQPATAKLYGGIAPNQTPPPTLAPGGTLNNLNPVVGAPLAPGTIAQVFGSGLATAAVSTGVLPLPKTFDNTFALVGPAQAPLYFLSGGQINIEVPYEATATQQLPIILSVNNALTLPLMLNIVPAAPGVLSYLDGLTPPSLQNGAHVIAQHSADGSLVTSSSPAKPGEYVVIYLVGLGATNPSVDSGAATPPTPLHRVTAPVTVTVASEPANVTFAGLTAYFVGLYQIDFQVPTDAASGDLELDVTQNNVAANPTKLPVSQ